MQMKRSRLIEMRHIHKYIHTYTHTHTHTHTHIYIYIHVFRPGVSVSNECTIREMVHRFAIKLEGHFVHAVMGDLARLAARDKSTISSPFPFSSQSIFALRRKTFPMPTAYAAMSRPAIHFQRCFRRGWLAGISITLVLSRVGQT